jgi:dimethylglycine dehydrogenase
VVIGGGIAGCSTLYHLPHENFIDLMLIERNKLTYGTARHSAVPITIFGQIQMMIWPTEEPFDHTLLPAILTNHDFC